MIQQVIRMKSHIEMSTRIQNLFTALLAVLVVTTLNSCFDSSTEQAPPSVNVPPPEKPLISNDTLSVPPDTQGIVDVLGNDQTTDGSTLVIEQFDATSAHGGIVMNNGDGTLTYTPANGYEGEDSFSYTVKTSKGAIEKGQVAVTVSNDVIPNGKAFYADNCSVCHSMGTEDTTTAFNASNLSLSASRIAKNLTAYGGDFKLMGAFYDIPQVNVDELKAYIQSL